uniref:Uncharacterized protein n=1 Tax=Ditylenchus dipsaci TaxID=166011 RepID=A0A915EW69_9BILA
MEQIEIIERSVIESRRPISEQDALRFLPQSHTRSSTEHFVSSNSAFNMDQLPPLPVFAEADDEHRYYLSEEREAGGKDSYFFDSGQSPINKELQSSSYGVNNYGYDLNEVHTSEGGARIVQTHGGGELPNEEDANFSSLMHDRSLDSATVLHSSGLAANRTTTTTSRPPAYPGTVHMDSDVSQTSDKLQGILKNPGDTSWKHYSSSEDNSLARKIVIRECRRTRQKLVLFTRHLLVPLQSTANKVTMPPKNGHTPAIVAVVEQIMEREWSPKLCGRCSALYFLALPEVFCCNSFTAVDFNTGYVAIADHALTDEQGRHTTCFIMQLDRNAMPDMSTLQDALSHTYHEVRTQYGWQEYWQYNVEPVDASFIQGKFKDEIDDCKNVKWYFLKHAVYTRDSSCSECYDFCLPDYAVQRRQKYEDEVTLGIRRLDCFRLYVGEWSRFRVDTDESGGHWQYPKHSPRKTQRDEDGNWVDWFLMVLDIILVRRVLGEIGDYSSDEEDQGPNVSAGYLGEKQGEASFENLDGCKACLHTLNITGTVVKRVGEHNHCVDTIAVHVQRFKNGVKRRAIETLELWALSTAFQFSDFGSGLSFSIRLIHILKAFKPSLQKVFRERQCREIGSKKLVV